MGVNLGSLIQGLSTAAGGVAEGLNERKKREQQALHQRLADELIRAQIGNYQSESQARQHPEAPVVGSPEWLKAQKDLATMKAGVARSAKSHVPLTDNEKRAAREFVRGVKEMRAHYRADSHAAETSTQTAILSGVGHFADKVGLGGLPAAAAQRSRSTHQQGFQRGAVTARHHYGMISPHARISLGLLHDINTGIVPPAGTDSSTIATSFAPEWDNMISQVEAQIGETVPEPDVGAPKAPVTPKAPAAPRVNRKFWHP